MSQVQFRGTFFLVEDFSIITKLQFTLFPGFS